LFFFEDGKRSERRFWSRCQQSLPFAANALELNSKFNV
jgi:hypothetical protein